MSLKSGKVRELSVLIRCEPHLVAVPVQAVHRLVLLSEAREFGSELVAVDGELYAKWDLAEMMGLPAAPRAFVLSRVQHGARVIPMALRVGRCLAIDEIGELVPLPEGLLRMRRSAFLGVFSVDEKRGELAGDVVGVMIDLANLWTKDELDRSMERIRVGPSNDKRWSSTP